MRPFALILVLALAACVEPTAHAPADPGASHPEGYSETRIEPGRWRVAFAGNSVTSREAVENALLFRAAEVTLREGGDWFRVVEGDLETDIRRVVIGGDDLEYPGLFGRRRGVGYVPFGGLATLDTREVKRFTAIAEILVEAGAKPEGDADAYDARAVIDDLGPKLTGAAG